LGKGFVWIWVQKLPSSEFPLGTRGIAPVWGLGLVTKPPEAGAVL